KDYSYNKGMKYDSPKSEGEILPNKLGINDPKQIQKEEYRGFLRAELKFESEIERIDQFDWDLISLIHESALIHLYEFAGKLRQVNISKAGFLFPAAQHLDNTVQAFEQEFLKAIPKSIKTETELIEFTAPVHAELLFIHPFREGNGRTARLFSNLVALKHGFERFHFDVIKESRMNEYIKAVQSAADKNYEPMEELFKDLGNN
ncbi:Fic family protein, partial [Balneolaceae bacterium ANBcel3]|nr:Fic family protein [Balneolaceae bacterium ANBcel3]